MRQDGCWAFNCRIREWIRSNTPLLKTALSNPAGDHGRHAEALAARDAELCASVERYGNLCLHLVRILALVDIECLPSKEFGVLQESDPTSALQLQHDPVGGWLQLRQMSGLVLKNALLSAPLAKDEGGHLLGGRMKVVGSMAVEIKQALLQCLMDPYPRNTLLSGIVLGKIYHFDAFQVQYLYMTEG